jgi:hydrogenase maturation protease
MKVLVAGIGNVLLGDDGFGVEVTRRLAGRGLPPGVRVVDFGIRGMDLTYALLDGYDAAVLVDVARRGGPPGTLYVLEPTAGRAGDAAPPEVHGLHPARALALAAALEGMLGSAEDGTPVAARGRAVLRLVACEPGELDEDEVWMGLSAPVEGAVDRAVALVESLLADLGASGAAAGEAAHA